MYTTNVYVPWGYINLTVNYLLQQFRLFELCIYMKTIYRINWRRQYIELIGIDNSPICDIL